MGYAKVSVFDLILSYGVLLIIGYVIFLCYSAGFRFAMCKVCSSNSCATFSITIMVC